MSRSGRFWLAVSLLTVALWALGYWQTEWAEKQVDVGYGEEAARNDFLAAELFLRERGLETETVTGLGLLDDLPPTDDLLLLSASRESLSDRRRRALIRWVRRGGGLLVVAHSTWDTERLASDDALMDELGVFLIALDEEVEVDASAAAAPETAPPREVEAEVEVEADASSGDDSEKLAPLPRTFGDLLDATKVEDPCWGEDQEPDQLSTEDFGVLTLELAGSSHLAVDDEDREAAYFSTHGHLLAMRVGDGHVTALTSVGPFRNARIGCRDHAFFLWLAAQGRAKVWLLHDPDVPSLGRLAWRELPATMAGGVLLIALFVASHSIRFGIPRATGEGPRRELREHLEASVTFHFRKGGFEALFERLREDLFRHGARLGARQGARDAERWAMRAELPVEDVRRALVEPAPTRRREIAKRVRTMLRMRRTR